MVNTAAFIVGKSLIIFIIFWSSEVILITGSLVDSSARNSVQREGLTDWWIF
jgi:hypothetical protein